MLDKHQIWDLVFSSVFRLFFNQEQHQSPVIPCLNDQKTRDRKPDIKRTCLALKQPLIWEPSICFGRVGWITVQKTLILESPRIHTVSHCVLFLFSARWGVLFCKRETPKRKTMGPFLTAAPHSPSCCS